MCKVQAQAKCCPRPRARVRSTTEPRCLAPTQPHSLAKPTRAWQRRSSKVGGVGAPLRWIEGSSLVLHTSNSLSRLCRPPRKVLCNEPCEPLHRVTLLYLEHRYGLLSYYLACMPAVTASSFFHRYPQKHDWLIDPYTEILTWSSSEGGWTAEAVCCATE